MNLAIGTFRLLWIVFIQLALAQAVCAQPEAHIVPVPRVVIYGGDVIADAALTDKTLGNVEFLRAGPLALRGDLVGKVARRTLLPGYPVPVGAVKAADVVKQGHPTTALFEAGGLSISASVVPLQSGSAGEPLSFQNAESGVVMRGIAHEDGTIRVGSP